MTTDHIYYLSWVHQQPGGLVFETATLTFHHPITNLDEIQQVQDVLRADGYHDAIVLGCSLLSTRTPG